MSVYCVPTVVEMFTFKAKASAITKLPVKSYAADTYYTPIIGKWHKSGAF